MKFFAEYRCRWSPSNQFGSLIGNAKFLSASWFLFGFLKILESVKCAHLILSFNLLIYMNIDCKIMLRLVDLVKNLLI